METWFLLFSNFGIFLSFQDNVNLFSHHSSPPHSFFSAFIVFSTEDTGEKIQVRQRRKVPSVEKRRE